MSRPDALTEDLAEDQTGDSAVLAAAISRWMREKNLTLAVAESLTSGAVASTLGAAEAASEWFRSTHRLRGLALTGVGGPGATEGRPAGTVFLAVHGPGIDRVDECRFPGDPTEVVRAATLHGLRMLAHADAL